MRTVIGVIRGAVASETATGNVYSIGRLVAQHDFVLLGGGRIAGMKAAR